MSRYTYLKDGVRAWFTWQRLRAEWPAKHGDEDCYVTLTAPAGTLELGPTATEAVAQIGLIALAQRKCFPEEDYFYLYIGGWVHRVLECQTPDEIGRVLEDYQHNWAQVRTRRRA